MALIQCQFYSEVLNLSTSMTVILPQQTSTQIGIQNNKMMYWDKTIQDLLSWLPLKNK